jgi:O-antigen ligase
LVFGVILASIGFIFSIKLTSIGVISFLALWLLSLKNLNFSSLLKKSTLHLLVVFFIFLLIGFTYSEDVQQAQKLIIRHLSFLLFPLFFLTIKPFHKKEYHAVLKIFIYTNTVFFIVCFLNACYRQIIFYSQGGPFNWYFFYRYDFLEIFDQHPTYVSIFTLLSLSFLLENGKNLLKRNWLFHLLLLTQVISIVLYGSRIAYIILFILFLVYTYKNLKFKTKKEKGKQGFIYLMSLFIISIVSWNIPIVKERIQFTFGYQQDYKYNNQESIINTTPEEQGRILLWEDTFELIKKKPIFGYGTGSNNNVLIQKYKEKGHSLFLEKKYNAHNTYLELMLNGGVVLLLIYLTILAALLYQGFKTRNYLLFAFFLIMAITGLTETIIRVQGIVFFAFFYCFLLSTNTNNE